MSGLKTLAYLLILMALAISQPADLLRQACALVQITINIFY